MSTMAPLVLILVLLGFLALWLWMLVDAWKAKKALWVVGMLVTGPIATLIYYFGIYKKL